VASRRSGGGWAFGVQAESLSGSRPNIIFILSDDSGWGEIGASGNPVIQTPNVDRLWREGTRFMNYHVAPSCAPTRAQLMTGNHEFHSGVTHTIMKRNYLALDAITLPQVLKSAGYSTAMFGKWHLGLDEGYRPDQRGFDKAVTAAFDSQKSHWDPKLLDNGTQRQGKGYRTDVFFDEAMGWIGQHKQHPFFCYLPMYNAHGPTIVGKEWSSPYEDKGLYQPTTGRGFTAHDYYGMISNADHNMGRLLEFLETQGLTGNTLVIYSTDNGHAISGANGAGHDAKTGKLLEGGLYNMGMRGAKGQAWRGSSCVPLILRWPGRVAADTKVNRLAGGIDILPTLADLCGAEVTHKVAGRSLVPLIENPDAEVSDRMIIVTRSRWPVGEADEYKHRNYAIQTDRFRLVNGTGPQGPWKPVEEAELFDHQTDPAEIRDVSAGYPEKKQAMQAYYDAWWDSIRHRMVNEEASVRYAKEKATKNKENDL
jgi:arylsulfatase